MGELGTRWIVAGASICVAGAIGTPAFGWVVGIAAGWGVASTVLLRHNRSNPGIAGILAAVDAVAISLLLSSHSRLGLFGWLSVLPAMHATLRYRANPLPTMTLVASGVLAAHLAVHGQLPGWILFAQVGGILAAGFLLRRPEPETPTTYVGSTDPLGSEEPETYLGLRESFRKLKSLYRDLEWRSRKDRHCAHLLSARLVDPSQALHRLANEVEALTGVTRCTLYRADPTLRCFVSEGHEAALSTTGEPATNSETPGVLRIDPEQAPARIRHQADRLPAKGGLIAAHVPLTASGRIVGLCRIEAPAEAIDNALAAVEEFGPTLAELVVESHERAATAHRAKFLQLRAEFLLSVRGFANLDDLAQRTADFLLTLGFSGAEVRRGPSVVAQAGVELPNWGKPFDDLVAPDTANHPAIPAEDALKRRLGCYLSIKGTNVAISAGGQAGLLDTEMAELVRTATNDLDWLHQDGRKCAGAVSAGDFRERMKEPGILVLFERRNKENLVTGHSDAAKLRRKVLDFLPAGSALYFRDDGDILVHLPGARLAHATTWAEQVLVGCIGYVIRTASLWPPTPVIVEAEDWEPAALFNPSVA